MTGWHARVHRHRARLPSGFSVIELMIAMVIGLVLMTGLISVFLANNQSARLNQAIGNIQEDARFALETIARDIRMAGFQGCTEAADYPLNVIAIDAPIDDTSVGLNSSFIWLSKAVSATNWVPDIPWGSSFSPPTSYPAVTGTDVLALQLGDANAYSMDVPVGVTSANAAGLIQIEADPEDVNISTGDLAMISDCQGGDLFHVTDTTAVGSSALQIAHSAGSSTNSSDDLTRAYGTSDTLLRQTMVMRFNANIYYVGDTGLVNVSGDAISALYLQSYPFDTSNPPVELAQGVEQLAISFTQVDDTGNVRNVSAGDTAFEPASVQAVRIGLLLSSYELVANDNDTKTYNIAGQSVVPAGSVATGDFTHAADRRMRLAFNTTVKVRNTRTQQ